MPILPNLEGPSDLRGLNEEQLIELAAEIRAVAATSSAAWHLIPIDNYVGDRLVRFHHPDFLILLPVRGQMNCVECLAEALFSLCEFA